MIVDWDYVSLPAEDLGEAVDFYRNVLGLKHLWGDQRWAEFAVGSLRLALYPQEPAEGQGGEVAFLVEDLGQEVERLRGRGVQFPHGLEAFDTPGGKGRLARFQDPSGNRLELVERG